jgi:hypothetical protein
MRSHTEIEKDLRFNNSTEGNFHKTVKLLQEAGEGYRKGKTYNERVMYSSILSKYGALNINNNSGMWVIAL